MQPLILPPLTREQFRSIDRRAIDHYGMNSLVLMENAGRGCADKLCELGIQGNVAILCGHGNNGGDGLVMARHLRLRGHSVMFIYFGGDYGTSSKRCAPDAGANMTILIRSQMSMMILPPYDDLNADDELLNEVLEESDWIVDALLGTGSVGNPRIPTAVVIGAANRCRARKLAIDLPSGLDCDTGIPGVPTFRADHTCTFVAPKIGFTNPAAKEYLGTVSVHDIGVPRKLLEEFLPQE